MRLAMTGMKRLLLFVLLGSAVGAADWPALTPAEFAARPEVQSPIDPQKFDQPLLVAAIFHETNRVRRSLGLAPFTTVARLDEAADLKAVFGTLQFGLTHQNPLPLTATPADRVRSVGLSYRQVAENIGLLGLLDVATRTQVGLRKRDGRDEYYHLDSGKPVERRTYALFAAAVVAAWMNSPPHRANIVNPAFVSLGCGARPCRDLMSGQDQIYAVQVFFTPR